MTPTLLHEFGAGLLDVSWRTGCVVLVLCGLRGRVRGRVPAQVWFAVWIVVALRLLVPVSVPAAWSPFNLVATREPRPMPAISIETRETTNPAVGQPTVPAADGSSWTWGDRGLAVWLSGVVGLTGWRLGMAARFRRSLRTARISTDERWLAVVAAEAGAMGIRAPVECWETAAVEAPALGGWFRPRLFFPPGFAAKLTDDELRFVVRHELAHWRRRDLPAHRLMHVAVVLHWLNPLVWLAARLARADGELACDEFVLRRERPGGGEAYGAALLKVLGLVGERRRPLAVVGILEGRRQLAERIRQIAGYRPASFSTVTAGAVLVAVVAAGSLTRESRAAEEVTTAPSSETAATRDEARARADAARRSSEALNAVIEEQRRKVEQQADLLLAYKEKQGLTTEALAEKKALLDEQVRATTEQAARAEKELERLKQESIELDRARTAIAKLESDLKQSVQVLRAAAHRARDGAGSTGSVMITGAVGRPGAYPLFRDGDTPQRLSLVELISRAGSFNRQSDRAHVIVKRGEPRDPGSKVMVFDFDRILRETADVNFVVEPGDVILVPERER